ncbi:MAG: NHLP leader peptide family RiPP precursor [Chloroflexi bacterium]|nr:NHLP leader peptide family RiPP precursor [Chloroflexota bacterium]
MTHMSDDQDQAKLIGHVVAKAWSDERFKRALMDDPTSVLKQHGIDVPAGMEVRAVENTDAVSYFVLPQRPAELSNEQLDAVLGGACACKFSGCRYCE